MKTELIKELDGKYEEYLSDESKMKGFASTISFPETKEEIAEIVKCLGEEKIPITVQGGKTGICGGAVPLGGHVMNLTRMNKFLSFSQTENGYFLKVQPGVLLSELRRALSLKSFETKDWDEESLHALKLFKKDVPYFWPPDPTETAAAIGGMLGANAQSITDFRYGRIAEYVEEIELIDYRGDIIKTDRKDLYLGSEGMYGIFVSAVLKLIKKPSELWGIGFFFEEQLKMLLFAEKVLQLPGEGTSSVAAVEYMDHQALNYISRLRQVSSKLKEMPDVDEKFVGMIYVELHGEHEEEIMALAESLMELAAFYGNDGESTWAFSGEAEIDKIKLFRHSAPESVNNEIKRRSNQDPRITKLSTDLTTKNSLSEDVLQYQRDASAEDLEIVIFGHVPENRVHVNIIPGSFNEFERGKKLVETWYRRALASGGTVFREHGIGKVKRELFDHVTAAEAKNFIGLNKRTLDPYGMFNPGNMFIDSNATD